VNTTILRV